MYFFPEPHNCEDEVIELNREATAMNNSVDIKLVGEDYTIGKVLEYVLHEEKLQIHFHLIGATCLVCCVLALLG